MGRRARPASRAAVRTEAGSHEHAPQKNALDAPRPVVHKRGMNDARKKLGEALLVARQSAGLSLRDLATKVDSHPATFSQLERALPAAIPSDDLIKKIARALKVDPGPLLDLAVAARAETRMPALATGGGVSFRADPASVVANSVLLETADILLATHGGQKADVDARTERLEGKLAIARQLRDADPDGGAPLAPAIERAEAAVKHARAWSSTGGVQLAAPGGKR